MKYIKDLGMVYPANGGTRKYHYYECECKCGKVVPIRMDHFKSGKVKQCRSCQIASINTSHGDSKTRLYGIFHNMHKRCKTGKYWKDKGIVVCDDWKDFETFKKWAVSNGYNDSLEIDRRDNDLNYTPSNCRWVNRLTQSANRDKTKANTSGYIGIELSKSKVQKYIASIRVNKKLIRLGTFNTIQEAIDTRNQYIVDNSLPHKQN